MVTDAFRYDAYGQTVATFSVVGGSGLLTSWRYQGRLDISPTSDPLYANGARLYSPSLGTFTSLDTTAGKATNPLSMNRFLYAEANPATFIDPSGHATMHDDGGSAGTNTGPPASCGWDASVDRVGCTSSGSSSTSSTTSGSGTDGGGTAGCIATSSNNYCRSSRSTTVNATTTTTTITTTTSSAPPRPSSGQTGLIDIRGPLGFLGDWVPTFYDMLYRWLQSPTGTKWCLQHGITVSKLVDYWDQLSGVAKEIKVVGWVLNYSDVIGGVGQCFMRQPSCNWGDNVTNLSADSWDIAVGSYATALCAGVVGPGAPLCGLAAAYWLDPRNWPGLPSDPAFSGPRSTWPTPQTSEGQIPRIEPANP